MIVLSLYADLKTPVNQVSNWHPGLRKNLHSPRVTALRLRTRVITLFSFDRIPASQLEIFIISHFLHESEGV